MRHLDVQRVVVDQLHARSQASAGAAASRIAQREQEALRLQLAQQVAHAVAHDDAAVIDDGDVAAEVLRLFQVVRGQDDGRALRVDLAQELPHRAADLDIHARRRLIQDQQPRLVHQRARDHQPALHAAGQRARHGLALVPQLQLLQVFLGAHARHAALHAVEARLVHHDGLGRFEHVEVDFLRHDADAGFGALDFAVDVVAEHTDLAGRSCSPAK